MSLSHNLLVLAGIAAVFIILLVLFVKSLPRNDNFHRNITRRTGRIITLFLAVALVMVAVWWIRKLKDTGVGLLLRDADSMKAVVETIQEDPVIIPPNDDGPVGILIDSSGIEVAGVRYENAEAATKALTAAAGDARDVIVTEEYARAETVRQVLDILATGGKDIDEEDVVSR